jgi:hypothetical protein
MIFLLLVFCIFLFALPPWQPPLQRWPHRPAARQQLAPRLFDFRRTREGGVAVAQAGLHDAAAGLKYLKSDGVFADDDTETGLRTAKCKTKQFHSCFYF